MNTLDRDTHIKEIVAQVNRDLPLHSMWDGFWIRHYKRGTLIISGSLDSMYYREYDVIFKRVIFFDLPETWKDTWIAGNNLVRIATKEEFRQYYPDFDTKEHFIFAIDIMSELGGEWKDNPFFIVGRHLYLEKCEPGNTEPAGNYTDPFENERIFPLRKNRIIKKE